MSQPRTRRVPQRVEDAIVEHLPEVYGTYRVSRDGTIYRRARVGGWEVAPQYGTSRRRQYRVLVRSVDGGQRREYAHRIVATAYLPNPDNLPQVNHIDGDTTNNSVDNLEWCTRSYNQRHAYANGLHAVHTCSICGRGTCRVDNVCMPCRHKQDKTKRDAVRLEVRSLTAAETIARYEPGELPTCYADIIEMWGAGMSDQQIAEACSISRQRVHMIRRAYL